MFETKGQLYIVMVCMYGTTNAWTVTSGELAASQPSTDGDDGVGSGWGREQTPSTILK